MKWQKFPFLRVTPCFILGILISDTIDTSALFPYALFLILISILWINVLYKSKKYYFSNNKIFQGVVLLFAFVVFGNICNNIHVKKQYPACIALHYAGITSYKAEVRSRLSSNKNEKYIAEIQSIRVKNKWVNTSGKILLYNRSNEPLNCFTTLLIKGSPEWISQAQNPYMFDYQKYMKNQGVYLNDHLNNYNNQVLKRVSSGSLYSPSLQTRSYLQGIIETYITDVDALALISALLLGDKQFLEPDLLEDFKTTGATHILAISGLHVGIVYMLCSFLLGFLKRGKLKYLNFFITILILWSYAFVSGLSPSVFRASLMFSVFSFGTVLKRTPNPYNSVFVSAFLLLIFNPQLIYSVSFQLSYTAVLGVVLLYKSVYTVFVFEYRIFDYFWRITAVSVSVQITTLPLVLYYFHQFPVYSFVTNLVVIPGAALIITLGFIMMLASPFGPLAEIMGKVLSFVASLMYKFISFVAGWPFNKIEGIEPVSAQVLALFIILGLLLYFLKTKKLRYMLYATIGVFLLSSVSVMDKNVDAQQKMIVFYKTDSNLTFDVFTGLMALNFNASRQPDHTKEMYQIVPVRKHFNIGQTTYINSNQQDKAYEVFMISGKSFLYLKEQPAADAGSVTIRVDYLIIRNEQVIQPEMQIYADNVVVLDPALPENAIHWLESHFPEATIHILSEDLFLSFDDA